MTPARKQAFRILLLVEKGAHADDLLFDRLSALSERDAALATELVLGSLRRRNQLDFRAARAGGRDPAGFDAEVRVALRLGIYQICHLSRVPVHAAVSESVDLVKWSGKGSAGALVNAVLRKVKREEIDWPSAGLRMALPEWLAEKWVRDFGADRAAAIAAASLAAPETYVRVPVSQSLRAEQLPLEATSVRGCYRVVGRETGGFRIQDIGSQTVVPLLELEPRQTFLDLCAAPGNKTAQALEAGVWAVACDFYPSRIRALSGLNCRRVVLDAAAALPFGQPFDRILLDAPCSGTGTLRRNPEIRWRLEPGDLTRHAGRQLQMLRRAFEVLAPGGRLVYSTCSLEREENEAVVEEALREAPGRIRLGRMERRTPGEDAGDGFFAAVINSV